MQRLIRSGTLQAKLNIGQPGDRYEQEVDKVADAVMHMPEVQRQEELEEEEEMLQAKPLVEETTPLVQTQIEPEEEEEELQPSATSGSISEINPNLESHIQSLKRGGQYLSENSLTFFEYRLNHRFGHVKIHAGSQAAGVARSVSAKAFTVGQDIVFGTGQYAPTTPAGKKLLTHVVQQSNSQSVQSMNTMLQKADNDCTPASGIPNTNCGAYAANGWWLTLAYVNNATCACQTTPNVPTANCVRKLLQDRLAATPGWLKVMAFSRKSLDNPKTYAKYQAFVQTFLTPGIYRDHVYAYRSCCCPSGPAPYPAWIGVTSVPLPCSVVGWSIRYFGSCHGTPGRW